MFSQFALALLLCQAAKVSTLPYSIKFSTQVNPQIQMEILAKFQLNSGIDSTEKTSFLNQEFKQKSR